jgi:N-carbamoylputrescine amidase
MTSIKVAATQMACSWDRDRNLAQAEELVREAAGEGARIILIQELFQTPYFCKDELVKHYDLAVPVSDNPAVKRFAELAEELDVVLPVSVFERAGMAMYNSMVMIDAGGANLGTYRKTHIPDAPGYAEKYYFNPGDTGFNVWQTRYGRVGTLICWDQWFPEPARILALKGAEILLYPTAIGSDINGTQFSSLKHWQNVMCGHAAANLLPVVASNRIGLEEDEGTNLTFYGGSFIADHTGEKIAEAGSEAREVLVAEVDLEAANERRITWNVFRDRRPEMYREILTTDGENYSPTVRALFAQG